MEISQKQFLDKKQKSNGTQQTSMAEISSSEIAPKKNSQQILNLNLVRNMHKYSNEQSQSKSPGGNFNRNYMLLNSQRTFNQKDISNLRNNDEGERRAPQITIDNQGH